MPRSRLRPVALGLACLIAGAGCTPAVTAPEPQKPTLVAPPLPAPPPKPIVAKAPPRPGSFLLARRPKLVVVIALDQFRSEYLTRFDRFLSPRGFKRFLREGATMVGHYGHYATYTGPGHALILSGSYPYVNGIAANGYFNFQTERFEAMVFDDKSPILGVDTKPLMDVSPRNFNGSTIGDELHLATAGRSRTLSLATKGRGAILLGGRTGKTFYMNQRTGEMTTSAYYMPKLPAWVTQWNSKKLADSYFGKEWNRLLPPAAYSVSLPDSSPWEGSTRGLGVVFPHVVNGKLTAPGPHYYEAFMRTPFANEWELDFARTAVDAEKLGQRGVTDLLCVSLSAIDLASHDYGPYSQELQDLVVRTDRQLADFLDWVYRRLGQKNVTVVITADHGSTPIPEQMTQMGFNAGRIRAKAIKETIEAALKKRFGARKGGWVIGFSDPHIFLDRKHLERRADRLEIERAAGEAAVTVPGVGGYLTRSQMLRGEVPNTAIGRALFRSYYQPRGGDVLVWTLPYYIWGKYAERDAGTTHGSLYRYDSEVPILMSGPGIRPGRYGVREMVDLAPTLAMLLGIATPAGSEGRAIPLFNALVR